MCIDKYLSLFDNVVSNFWKGLTTLAAMKRQNISIEPEVYEQFCKYASRHGIKLSTWINAQMKEFIEDQKLLDELKEQKKRL